MFDSIQETFRRNGFVRTREGRVLGGVIAGLGRRMGMEAWRARLLFVLVLLLIPGSQLVIYPILWLLMPRESSQTVTARPAAST